jgi:hypothetical protein
VPRRCIKAIARIGGIARSLPVESDHPAGGAGTIEFVTERSWQRHARLLVVRRLQNCDRRRRRGGASLCFEGWVLAAAWIGASDRAACGPRNPARATPRRGPLISASRIGKNLARETPCIHRGGSTAPPSTSQAKAKARPGGRISGRWTVASPIVSQSWRPPRFRSSPRQHPAEIAVVARSYSALADQAMARAAKRPIARTERFSV